MRLLEFSDSDYEIHNRTKLDQILVELCHQIIKGKQHDPIKYGMVAACVLDPKNRTVFGINEAAENNKRRHAERVAMDRYVEQHGEIPKGSIIITTLSPCNEYNTHMADERYGESCTDIINNSMVRKVYCGYQDPSQDNEHNEYTLEQTSNSDVKELCKKFADTFLDNAHKNLSENTAAGITKAFNSLGDPVYANLQRVALLAMQGRQSEAAGRLQTVIKHADPAVQKKITDAVNNIKPVTINGRVADSNTLDKSKQHNDWIINTFIPWVQSLLGEQGVAEGLEDNGISFKVQKGKNKFATTLSVGSNPVGVYQYDATTGRSIAEVYPEFKGKGLGKLLVLHAIYTAAELGLDFQEDESRTSEYDNVLDSLSSNGYIVDDDGYWYVTGEGEQYLQQSMKQGIAEGESNDTAISLSKLGKFHPGADTLAQFVPERATAQYALHPDKWESTFYSLTNKDSDKLKYYGPKKISIPPGTLVGDMAIANKFYRAKTTVEKQQYAEAYKQSLKPYPVDVGEYRMPELLIPRQGVVEGFPQPGESSGKAKQFNPNAKVQTKEMTLDQILATVKGIPYVNNVVDDWDAKDYSWGVTKKVIEYAQYLQKNPQSVANLPPLVVIDGQLNDGAHRLSAINLLQKRMDPKNPLWKQVKLKVNFGTSADVASEQGVAEGSEPQVGDAVYYGKRLVGWFKGYSEHGKIITEPNYEEMGDEYANRDVYWDPQDKITIKPEQGVAENFADGKNPERKGLAKRSGVNTKASVSSLRNTAKHSSGEKQRMAHWLANMKAGRAKK
jgi:pyrimidine deaminase RibD-like protein/GNAT superfamily N-acetyltransferase